MFSTVFIFQTIIFTEHTSHDIFWRSWTLKLWLKNLFKISRPVRENSNFSMLFTRCTSRRKSSKYSAMRRVSPRNRLPRVDNGRGGAGTSLFIGHRATHPVIRPTATLASKWRRRITGTRCFFISVCRVREENHNSSPVSPPRNEIGFRSFEYLYTHPPFLFSCTKRWRSFADSLFDDCC